MFTSITQTDSEEMQHERVPSSSPPWVWVGFLFVAAFLTLEFAFVLLELDEPGINAVLTLIAIGGFVYWVICVYQIHKILNQLTSNRYLYSPGEAAGKHFIPFLNLVWIFQWPAELARYINARGRVKMISGGVIGTMILLALLLRFLDGAVGMAFLFGITMYVSGKVKAHVKAVKGVSPDQLPPLPDPRVFSRPIDSPATARQEVVGGSEPVKSS